MNILLPYAREAVSDMTTRGGFPPLLLAPVNFDALYQQHIKEQQAAEALTEDPEAQQNTTPEDPSDEGQANVDEAQKDQANTDEVVKH